MNGLRRKGAEAFRDAGEEEGADEEGYFKNMLRVGSQSFPWRGGGGRSGEKGQKGRGRAISKGGPIAYVAEARSGRGTEDLVEF